MYGIVDEDGFRKRHDVIDRFEWMVDVLDVTGKFRVDVLEVRLAQLVELSPYLRVDRDLAERDGEHHESSGLVGR